MQRNTVIQESGQGSWGIWITDQPLKRMYVEQDYKQQTYIVSMAHG